MNGRTNQEMKMKNQKMKIVDVSEYNAKLRGAQTADQSYKAAKLRVEAYLVLLQAKLDDHAVEQAERPKDWGYAGDLGHIEEQLKNAIGEHAASLLTEYLNGK